jgi:hypothetical protein
MARRKNTRRFDPRYFMDEKMERLDEKLQEGPPEDFLLIVDRKFGGFNKLFNKFEMTWNFEGQHSDGSITLIARDKVEVINAALSNGIDKDLQNLIQSYNEMGRGGTLVGGIQKVAPPHGDKDRFGGSYQLRITLSGQ